MPEKENNMAPTERLGCIGLGELGLAVAGNLIAAGFAVSGFRRSALANFSALGGRPLGSSAAVMRESDILLTCLPSGDALREVVCGAQGLASAARPGQIVIELSTAALAIKQELADRLAGAGVVMLDC